MANISAIKLPDGVTYDIKDNSSGYITGMTILSYGSSTWDNFIEAYNANKVVYCRASSNSNPASGSQTRLAFMAYVNNATTPTNVEFQYYRSVSSHTASQQGDQVYVYKLDKTSGWSVTTREASVKVVAGTGLGGTYSNGTMTLTGPTKVSDLTNDSGFITGYTETDPIFSASAAAGIVSSDITNWNGKQAALVSGTNIKTINNESLLGSGNITVGGDINVQSDWNQSDSTADDYIKNKPTNATISANGLMSSTDKSKLDGIESGAEVNYVTKITQHFIADPNDSQYVYPRSATLDYNAVGINDVELLTKTALGKFNGVCDLDASSKVPKSRLPSTSTPTTGEVAEFDSDAHMNSTDMTTGSGSELEDFIDGLNVSGASNYIVVEALSKSTGSISANNGVNVTFDLNKTGYTPVGIVGIQFTGSASGYCQPRQFRIENGDAVIYAWNSGSSAYTWTAICWVLFVKN